MGYRFFEVGIVACIVALVGLLFVAAKEDRKAREAWFAECVQHEPKYKCEVQWKAANRSDFSASDAAVMGFVGGMAAGMAGGRR